MLKPAKDPKNQFFLLLIVSALILSGITVASTNVSVHKNVLSESSGESSGGGRDSGSSGSSGGSSVQVLTQTQSKDFNLTQTLQKSEAETPEPSEKPEVVETPEPSETPEAETEVETEVKDGTEAAKIKIHKGNEFQFEQEGLKFQVQSKFPLSVNSITKELAVTTPAGTKVVATLPDQAVQNMLSSGIISQVLTNPQTGQNEVQLATDSSGNPVFEVNGVKFERLLGIFNIAIDKTGQISAQNGQIVGVSQSSFSKLLDSLSF